VGAKEELKGVEPDLVLLDVGVHEHHRLDLVVDAVPNEVKLEDELLAEDKPKVSLTEELVEEGVVLFDELVENVLQDRSNFSHLEDLKPSLVFDLLVHLVVKRNVLHWAHPVSILERSSKLSKDLVACVNNKFEIGSAALLVEQEDELVVEAKPVEEHHRRPDQAHVLMLRLCVRLIEGC